MRPYGRRSSWTYLNWTEDNLLRQLSYQRQREDKFAWEVVRAFEIGESNKRYSPTAPRDSGRQL